MWFECYECSCQFRVKRYKKPYIGMYKGDLVFHWHYFCVECGKKYTVRYWNKSINPYTDRVAGLEFRLHLHRFDEDKRMGLLNELEVAQDELDKINKEVMGKM